MSATKTLELVLIDRSESDFILEGTEGTDREKRLDAPGDYRLPSESYVIEKVKNVDTQRQIRYVKGATSIYVEDQERFGTKPNDLNDVIWFKNGELVVKDTPESKALYEYLTRCAWNRDAPGRPSGIKPVFYVNDRVDKSEKELIQRSFRIDALQLIQSLTEIKNGGKVSYDETRINFLCNLFNISTALSNGEKCNLLMDKAEADPEGLINSVANKNSEYRASINEAISTGVLTIDGDKALFPSSKKAFFQFSVKEAAKRVDELLIYMLSTSEGELAYKELTIELTAAKGRIAGGV